MRVIFYFMAMILISPVALASGTGTEMAHGFDASILSLWWTLPFVGILLSIALFPLILPRVWHAHFGKIAAFWALCFLIPFMISYGFSETLYELLHTFFLEYIPFILLLFALFTVAGGVRLKGSLVGSPIVNTVILGVGTILAGWMGTTGAAMLLIRPILRANEQRRYRVHTVVFFIFLVANIGGSLSPLGDPPLFLGFLKGVHFFWPTEHLFVPMLFVACCLLVVYYIIDRVLFAKERPAIREGKAKSEHQPLRLEGAHNLLYLGAIVVVVLQSGLWKAHGVTIHGVAIDLSGIIRDVSLVLIAILSMITTSRKSRIANGFSWSPILEVAKLFAGIFVTIIPAIAILKMGEHGALSPIVSLVSTPDGSPIDLMYFWATGLLSSFLDNAPTYLVFFNTAGGDATHLMGPMASTLLAISAGAVFMGANTYIGNAPNFMVKAIAEESDIKMPSFFGYMLWSICILLPLFALVSLIWF